MVLKVSSEIGPLRQVIVHRPGIEIARITPENKDALLFDDLLWLERAQEEHDAFTGILRDAGAEVLLFESLLAEVLEIPEARKEVVARAISPATCGRHVAEALTERLLAAPAGDVVDVLLGGLLERELIDWGIEPVFADLVADRFHYVLRPLPNLLFMRDNAAWINDGLVFNVLATPARSRESDYMWAIYHFHPRFADVTFPVWFGKEPTDRYPATIEGGDVLVLDERTVVLGLSERTAPAAVETLAERLFAGSTVEHVIVVHLHHARAMMHLDTAFTMVDRDAFNVFPGLLSDLDVHVLRPASSGGIDVTPASGLEAAVGEALGLNRVRMIPTGGDAIGRLREQWDDGNNTLAVAPGVVVAYQRNQETNRRLRDAGIEVLELDSSELCRGRGGSRCMTQPLMRDPI
ncbi:MAG: arginine deiminase [Acidimicrobiia bacterium]|nr:arginine deiminase [Acidimicrobiia bacterium]